MKTIQELIKAKREIYKYFTDEESLKAVKQDGYALRYVRNQTEQICLEAVKQNGNTLQYVRNQTELVCLEAVKQDGYALRYVNEDLFIVEREMTIEDIETELGCRIKIIK